MIASKKYSFISRGDDSGIHKKGEKLLNTAGIEPVGKWYIEAGQGMGAVIQMAGEKKAYTIANRDTFLSFSKKIDLVVLCEDDPMLFNLYGVMAVNPERHKHASYTLAMAYIRRVTSQQGQKIIHEFGKEKFGQPLFIPTAIKY